MSAPRVLIVGASARAAAASAQRAGFDVVASDMFGDVDLKRIASFIPVATYPDDLASIIEEQELPVVYTGGLENEPRLLAKARCLWGIRDEPLLKVRDPFWWSSVLRAAGFRVPQVTRRHPDGKDSFLLKPVSGAGGGGVSLAKSDPIKEGMYLQEFIPGQAMGAVFIAAASRAILCGVTACLVWKDHPETDFAYGGSFGPGKLPDRTRDQLSAIGNTLAEKAGLCGLFGVDFILNNDQVAIPIEVNPRYTASVEVLELAGNISLFESHHRACCQKELCIPEPRADLCVAKVILYACETLVVPADIEQQILPDNVRMADVPTAGTTIQHGNPLCTLLAVGSCANEVRDKLRAVPLIHQNASRPTDMLG